MHKCIPYGVNTNSANMNLKIDRDRKNFIMNKKGVMKWQFV